MKAIENPLQMEVLVGHHVYVRGFPLLSLISGRFF